MIKLKLVPQDILKTETDLVVVSLFKDFIPLKGIAGYVDWMYNGKVSALIKSKKIFGIYKETLLLSTEGKIPADKILFVGFGSTLNLDTPKLVNLYSYILETLQRINIYNFGISIDYQFRHDSNVYMRIWENMIEGLINGAMKGNNKESQYILKIAEGNSLLFLELKSRVRSLMKKLEIESLVTLEN